MAQVGFWMSIARSCWVSGPFQQQNKGREHRSPLSGKCNNRFAFLNLRIDDIKRPHPLRHRNKCHLVQLLPLNPPDAAAAANTWADDEQQKLSIIKAARQSQYLTPYQVHVQALLCPALTISSSICTALCLLLAQHSHGSGSCSTRCWWQRFSLSKRVTATIGAWADTSGTLTTPNHGIRQCYSSIN